MKNKNVLFVPDFREGNPYQELLAESLKKEHISVEYAQFPNQLFPLFALSRKHKNMNVIHIHWIVELIKRTQWSNNKITFYIKALLIMVDCYLTRLFGNKVIWTIHNKMAHEQLDSSKELIVRRCLAKSVSSIIVHSKEALLALNKLYEFDLSSKTDVIFHGNYIDNYPLPSADKKTLRENKKISSEQLIISYIGMIKPYKGVEKLINAYKASKLNNSILLLSGSIASKEYKNELNSLIGQDPNIRTNFTFLSDQELIDSIALSNYICLPFSDTLTSGSTILAMSQEKALILPSTAKVFGCVPDKGVKYFNSDEELAGLLSNLDNMESEEMGAINLLQAKNMSWDKVAELTKNAYN